MRKKKAIAAEKNTDYGVPVGAKLSFAASEAYKLLRTNLMFSFSGEEKCSVIGITSTFRDEGKSITSVNLAYTLAQAQKRVLMIEGDMRLPTQAERLGLHGSPGLSNLLAGMNSVTEAVQKMELNPMTRWSVSR